MYETARLGVSCEAIAANGSVPVPIAPTPEPPPIAPACIVPGSIDTSFFRLSVCLDIPATMTNCLFPLTLRMHAKSRAKYGEVKGHRSGSAREGLRSTA